LWEWQFNGKKVFDQSQIFRELYSIKPIICLFLDIRSHKLNLSQAKLSSFS